MVGAGIFGGFGGGVRGGLGFHVERLEDGRGVEEVDSAGNAAFGGSLGLRLNPVEGWRAHLRGGGRRPGESGVCSGTRGGRTFGRECVHGGDEAWIGMAGGARRDASLAGRRSFHVEHHSSRCLASVLRLDPARRGAPSPRLGPALLDARSIPMWFRPRALVSSTLAVFDGVRDRFTSLSGPAGAERCRGP